MDAETWQIVGAVMVVVSVTIMVAIKPPRFRAWAFAVALALVSSTILVGATHDIQRRTICITLPDLGGEQ